MPGILRTWAGGPRKLKRIMAEPKQTTTQKTTQTITSLNEDFGLPGVLVFEQRGELMRARISLPTCDAEVYLQGAHLTDWQPAGMGPVFFLSAQSAFAPGKAIRGGVPICFPWFGPDQQGRAGGKPGPSHGFARTAEWRVAFAALQPAQREEAEATLNLTLTLEPSALSRSLGYDHFRVAYEMVFGGRTLTLRLSVANLGTAAICVEEALHSYFAVSDVREAGIEGLGGARFLDKTDGMQEKTAATGSAPLSAWTDRIYPANTSAVSIHDGSAKASRGRTIVVSKQNSATTVLWNPWAEATRTMTDLGETEWPGFVCVETANAGSDALSLGPGHAHTLEACIEVIPQNL